MRASLTDWAIFGFILFLLLFIDLWLQRNDHGSSRRDAVIWSIIWIGVGLAFSLYVQFSHGSDAAISI